jgi:hypothetical protein
MNSCKKTVRGCMCLSSVAILIRKWILPDLLPRHSVTAPCLVPQPSHLLAAWNTFGGSCVWLVEGYRMADRPGRLPVPWSFSIYIQESRPSKIHGISSGPWDEMHDGLYTLSGLQRLVVRGDPDVSEEHTAPSLQDRRISCLVYSSTLKKEVMFLRNVGLSSNYTSQPRRRYSFIPPWET